MSTYARCAPHSSRLRAALAGLVLISSVLLGACSPAAAANIAPAAGIPTPVPPAVLSTLAPAKPAHPADTTGGPSVSVENFNFVPADLTVPSRPVRRLSSMPTYRYGRCIRAGAGAPLTRSRR